jgi:hypothetical protein
MEKPYSLKSFPDSEETDWLVRCLRNVEEEIHSILPESMLESREITDPISYDGFQHSISVFWDYAELGQEKLEGIYVILTLCTVQCFLYCIICICLCYCHRYLNVCAPDFYVIKNLYGLIWTPNYVHCPKDSMYVAKWLLSGDAHRHSCHNFFLSMRFWSLVEIFHIFLRKKFLKRHVSYARVLFE